MVIALILSGALFAFVQPPPAADRPPRALIDLRDAAIAVYAPALAGDWASASDHLAAIDSAMAALPTDVGNADLDQQLARRIKALKETVRDRNSAASATNANWIARLAEEIAAGYETSVPVDVRLLAYFGRQVKADATAQQMQHVKSDIADLRTVWNRVERSVLQRKGVGVAKTFSDALARLDGATTANQLIDAADAEVAASTQVQDLFRRTPR